LIGIPPRKAGYNPADFAALRVHDDIRSLFEHIAAYKPRNVELDTRLRCFVPEYIPAVGEIDTFVKVRGGNPCTRACVCLRALALPRR
jgi:intraflagellar transport protein 46